MKVLLTLALVLSVLSVGGQTLKWSHKVDVPPALRNIDYLVIVQSAADGTGGSVWLLKFNSNATHGQPAPYIERIVWLDKNGRLITESDISIFGGSLARIVRCTRNEVAVQSVNFNKPETDPSQTEKTNILRRIKLTPKGLTTTDEPLNYKERLSGLTTGSGQEPRAVDKLGYFTHQILSSDGLANQIVIRRYAN